MKQLLLIILIWSAGNAFNVAKAQASDADKDTWYVWVDETVLLNGSEVHLVSKELTVITCCVKSAKYRRFVQKTGKWLRQNIAPDYNGELTLHKIQDKSLAAEMLAKAQAGDNVQLIDYQGSCK